jgi:hypothetical protein
MNKHIKICSWKNVRLFLAEVIDGTGTRVTISEIIRPKIEEK